MTNSTVEIRQKTVWETLEAARRHGDEHVAGAGLVEGHRQQRVDVFTDGRGRPAGHQLGSQPLEVEPFGVRKPKVVEDGSQKHPVGP
jgi:hypothetical protein